MFFLLFGVVFYRWATR